MLRELVDGQITYLEKTVRMHDGRAYTLILWTAAVIALAAVAPLVGAAGVPALLLFGALAAVVTPALISGLKSWGEATGSERRAQLHRRTLERLETLGARRGELEAAAACHDLPAALAYAEEVFAVLRADHA